MIVYGVCVGKTQTDNSPDETFFFTHIYSLETVDMIFVRPVGEIAVIPRFLHRKSRGRKKQIIVCFIASDFRGSTLKIHLVFVSQGLDKALSTADNIAVTVRNADFSSVPSENSFEIHSDHPE